MKAQDSQGSKVYMDLQTIKEAAKELFYALEAESSNFLNEPVEEKRGLIDLLQKAYGLSHDLMWRCDRELTWRIGRER